VRRGNRRIVDQRKGKGRREGKEGTLGEGKGGEPTQYLPQVSFQIQTVQITSGHRVGWHCDGQWLEPITTCFITNIIDN